MAKPLIEVRTQVEMDAALKKSPDARIACVGNAWFVARGLAHVEARESAHVVARGLAHVVAWGSAHVVASRFVAIHQHSDGAQVTDGVVIKVPPITTAEVWCEFYGASVIDGVATLFKAVDDAFKSGHSFLYQPGTAPVAPDWDGGTAECGGGLHFCATPIDALFFLTDAKRFVACPVLVTEIVVHHPASYPTKIKAPRVCAPIYEVDRYGKRITVPEVAA